MYVASCSGVFYALDRDGGEVAWSYDTRRDGEPATFHGDSLVADELVITGVDRPADPATYAFDRHSGEVRWRVTGEAGISESDVLRLDDTVVGRNRDGDLIGLDLATGDLLWTVAPRERRHQYGIDESPVAANGVVFTPALDGAIHAVDAGGTVLWRRPLGCAITTSPALGDDAEPGGGGDADLYAGCSSGEIFRLDAATGEILASASLGGRTNGRPLVTREAVVFLSGTSTFAALDRELARVTWKRRDEARWSSFQPILVDGNVLVGNGEGLLSALDPADGSVVWSRRLEGQIRGLGLGHGPRGRTLFVGTIEGTVYALALPDDEACGPGSQRDLRSGPAATGAG